MSFIPDMVGSIKFIACRLVNSFAMPLSAMRAPENAYKFVIDIPPGGVIYVDGQPIRNVLPERILCQMCWSGRGPMLRSEAEALVPKLFDVGI